MHGAVFVLVCCLLVMASSCPGPGDDDKPVSPLAYCAQDGLSAFPLGTDYVKGKFSAADRKVGLTTGPLNLSLQTVHYPDMVRDYWYNNCLRDGSGNPLCQSQLFAIVSFVDQFDVVIDTLAGLSWSSGYDVGSPSAFIAVVTLQSKFSMLSEDDCHKVIAKATIHELGHLFCNLTDCRDNPAAHVARECVMTDTGVEQVGSGWLPRNVCGTDVLVFNDDFCEWCRNGIKTFKIVPAP